MDPIAVNETIITPELFQEAFLLTFSKKQQKTLFLCGGVIALAGGVFLAVQFLFHKLLILGIPLLLMGVAVMVSAIRLPKSECKRKYKALCFKNSQNIVFRRAEFYDTAMTIFSCGEPLEIDYSEIHSVQETDHLIVLTCEGRRGIILNKSGFVIGCWGDVQKQNFLNQIQA